MEQARNGFVHATLLIEFSMTAMFVGVRAVIMIALSLGVQMPAVSAAQSSLDVCAIAPVAPPQLDSCRVEMQALGCDALSNSALKRDCAYEASHPPIFGAQSTLELYGCLKGIYGATVGAGVQLVTGAWSDAARRARYFSPQVRDSCIKREEIVTAAAIAKTLAKDEDLTVVRACKHRVLEEFPDLEKRYAGSLDKNPYSIILDSVHLRLREMKSRQPSLATFIANHPNDPFKALTKLVADQVVAWALKLSCYEPIAKSEFSCAAVITVLSGGVGSVKLAKALRGVGVAEDSALMAVAADTEIAIDRAATLERAKPAAGQGPTSVTPEAPQKPTRNEIKNENAPAAVVKPQSLDQVIGYEAYAKAQLNELNLQLNRSSLSSTDRAKILELIEELAKKINNRTSLLVSAADALPDGISARVISEKATVNLAYQKISDEISGTSAREPMPKAAQVTVTIAKDAVKDYAALQRPLRWKVDELKAEMESVPNSFNWQKKWELKRLEGSEIQFDRTNAVYSIRLNHGYRVVFTISPDRSITIYRISKTVTH